MIIVNKEWGTFWNYVLNWESQNVSDDGIEKTLDYLVLWFWISKGNIKKNFINQQIFQIM